MRYLIEPKKLLLIVALLSATTGVIQGKPTGGKHQSNYTKNRLDINEYSKLISETILPQEKRHLVYEFVEEYEENIDKEIIRTMVENYYLSDNSRTKWQIKTTLGALRTSDAAKNMLGLLRDTRVREEDDNDLFFSVLPSILHEDKESHLEVVLDFLAEQEVSDTHYPPVWFMPIYKTKHTSHLYDIIELKSPRSKSLLNFLISIQAIANHEDQKNIEKINIVRLTAGKAKRSESAEGISDLVGELLQTLDSDPKEQGDSRQEPNEKVSEGAEEWVKKFNQLTSIWDKSLADPKRIERRKKRSARMLIERDVNAAKSYYLAENEEKEGPEANAKNWGKEAQVTDILDYINAFRLYDDRMPIEGITDLEAEAHQKILSLGTYDSKDSSGEGITWGKEKEKF